MWDPGISFAQQGEAYCPLLDRMEEPIGHVSFGFVPESRIERFGHMGQLEMGGGAGLLYRRTVFGEWDVRAAFDAIYLTGDDGIRLPGYLAAIRLDIDYIYRMHDGYALRLGGAPGFYSEFSHLETDHFAFPFHVHGIRAFRPDLSALLGLHVYPGFDRLLSPRAGVRWVISDYLMLDAFYPRTEAIIRPGFEWIIRAGMEIRKNMEYHLKGSDDRKRFMMDETRMYIGVDRLMLNDAHFIFRLGRVVNRNVDFGRFEPGKNVSDAYFVQFGIGSYL